jgi:hypothetical protein
MPDGVSASSLNSDKSDDDDYSVDLCAGSGRCKLTGNTCRECVDCRTTSSETLEEILPAAINRNSSILRTKKRGRQEADPVSFFNFSAEL